MQRTDTTMNATCTIKDKKRKKKTKIKAVTQLKTNPGNRV